MSTPYRSELEHALDLTRVTINRTGVGVSIPFANDGQPKNDIIEGDDESGDEVYDSDVKEIFADATSTKADISRAATQATHSCRVMRACQWIDKGALKTCGYDISCKTVSAHFRDTHGIKGMKEMIEIRCAWKGCPKCVKRKGFARHIREPHLGHPRSKDSS